MLPSLQKRIPKKAVVNEVLIKHEGKGRLRVHLIQRTMSYRQADTLQYCMEQLPFVTSVKVYDKTQDTVICYEKDRQAVITALQRFSYEKASVPPEVLQNSGREMNEQYKEELVTCVVLHYGKCLFVPYPIRFVLCILKSCKYIAKGLKVLLRGKIEVPILDAVAIGVSVCRADISTAGSIMFLLKIGEIMEEWTHKKSVGDLARSMSLKVGKVWLVDGDGQEILAPADIVQESDRVCIHMGNVIPFDGEVTEGEGMVNQSSLTGESQTVRKSAGSYVYAGTV